MFLLRFSWSFPEVPHWVVYDVNRPNVPLMGDDAAALLASLNEVDEVKSFANFGAAGLKFALLSFVHIDLYGLGETNVMVAERKRTLDSKVPLSKRHCRNHATVLCKSCLYSAVDEKLIGWLHSCLQHGFADLRPFLSACAGDG